MRQRKPNIMILLTGRILKKWYKWTYLQNRNRVTDVEKQTYGYQGGKGAGGGINWEIGIDIYTQLYIK